MKGPDGAFPFWLKMAYVERYLDMEEMTEAEINRLLKRYNQFFRKHFKKLGSGRNRTAYLVNGYVIKVPHNLDCIADNEHEAMEYDAWGENESCILAPCRMLGDFLLIMEYLTPAHESYADLPDWVGTIDCGQVGYTKGGKLLAYDYGLL